ncbi:hypothetical protein LX36DRAFT_742244 [Colletotrichum falcatum]|nr:hypothetical protein LX36DRAFT_742244 [Colletotrichum falcatum]
MLAPMDSELVSNEVFASELIESDEAELVWAVEIIKSSREELLGIVVLEEATSDEVVAKEVASEEVASEEVVSEEVVSEEVVSEEVVSEEVVVKEAASKEVASEEVASEEVVSKEVVSEEVVSGEVVVKEAASGPVVELLDVLNGLDAVDSDVSEILVPVRSVPEVDPLKLLDCVVAVVSGKVVEPDVLSSDEVMEPSIDGLGLNARLRALDESVSDEVVLLSVELEKSTGVVKLLGFVDELSSEVALRSDEILESVGALEMVEKLVPLELLRSVDLEVDGDIVLGSKEKFDSNVEVSDADTSAKIELRSVEVPRMVLSVVEVTEVETKISEATIMDDVEDSVEETVKVSVLLVEVNETAEESPVDEVVACSANAPEVAEGIVEDSSVDKVVTCSVDASGVIEALEALGVDVVSEFETVDDKFVSDDWVTSSVVDEVPEEVATLRDVTDALWVAGSALEVVEEISAELEAAAVVASKELNVDMLDSDVSVCVLELIELWPLVADDDILGEDTLGEETLTSVEADPEIVSRLLEEMEVSETAVPCVVASVVEVESEDELSS